MADSITIPAELALAMRHAVLYELVDESSLHKLAGRWSEFGSDDSYYDEFWTAAARTERLLAIGRKLGLFDPGDGDVTLDGSDRALVAELANHEHRYQQWHVGDLEEGTPTRLIRAMLDTIDGLDTLERELRAQDEVPA